MNWKAHLQIRDLETSARIEATCRDCGHVHFMEVSQILRQGQDQMFLYIEELERQTICKARGCRGPVRLALLRGHKISAFVGGLP